MASVNTTLEREYDYDTYTYLAVLLTPSHPLLDDPSRIHPHLKHLGPAGALPDIHVFSVPKPTWEHSSTTIIDALHQADGILRVDVQEPRTRAKRDTAGLAS
ncbi:hypothetical protein DFH94DRAFT_168536 [Russula ochroleuca]|uniref:Uncharacterized protein n=1 Tax=Russula ochroleuca TaxID=152965 RepID=A0A9P5TDH5_9AGAM|nr:hypothetical protein DFH94DRAFT_168536 [Russula ochroleuca]